MLINHLALNTQAKITQLAPMLTTLIKRDTAKKRANLEISNYERSSLLASNYELLLDMYFALSVSTLQGQSRQFHSDKNAKCDRFMSSHETLIHNKLVVDYGILPIRQLLIGKTHSDLYLTEFHLCIEPSSERYFSTPARARNEKQTDFLRIRMNNLFSWHTEDYRGTTANLERTLINLALTNKRYSREEIKLNLVAMALNTIPFYIPYEDFSPIFKQHLAFESINP